MPMGGRLWPLIIYNLTLRVSWSDR